MLIGELSSRSELSKDTIRFYEKQGLITVDRKERRFNNYKEYSEETFQRLMSIKWIKNMGFTLTEVSEVLDMIDANEATCQNIADKIEDKVSRIDNKIKELLKVRSMLQNGLKSCCSPSNVKTADKNCCPIIVPHI
ncbi:MerR family transcriptional regulator [Chryseobacterium koreense]